MSLDDNARAKFTSGLLSVPQTASMLLDQEGAGLAMKHNIIYIT